MPSASAVVEHDVTVDGRELLAIVEEWLARGHRLYAELTDRHAKLIHDLRRGDRERVGLDAADRLLVAMGMEYRLAAIAPEPAELTPEEEATLWPV